MTFLDGSRRIYRAPELQECRYGQNGARIRKAPLKLPHNHWTVGDFDRAAFMRKRPTYTLQQVSDLLALTQLSATVAHLRKIREAGI